MIDVIYTFNERADKRFAKLSTTIPVNKITSA